MIGASAPAYARGSRLLAGGGHRRRTHRACRLLVVDQERSDDDAEGRQRYGRDKRVVEGQQVVPSRVTGLPSDRVVGRSAGWSAPLPPPRRRSWRRPAGWRSRSPFPCPARVLQGESSRRPPLSPVTMTKPNEAPRKNMIRRTHHWLGLKVDQEKRQRGQEKPHSYPP